MSCNYVFATTVSAVPVTNVNVGDVVAKPVTQHVVEQATAITSVPSTFLKKVSRKFTKIPLFASKVYLIVVDVIAISISLPSVTCPFRPTSKPGLSVFYSGDLLSRSVSRQEANQKGNLWAKGKI